MHQALKDFLPHELCVSETLNIGLLEIDVPGVALMPLSIMHHTYSEDKIFLRRYMLLILAN